MERVTDITKSGLCQFSARLRSSKAGIVSLSNVGEAKPPWHGIEDEPAWGNYDFQCLGCWKIEHGLIGGSGQYCAIWPFRAHLKQPAGEG